MMRASETRLYVYGLDGKVKSFTPAGRVNNVALAEMGGRGIIVVASDRNDVAAARLQLYRLDRRSGALTPLGAVDGGAGEAYGVCLLRRGRELHAFSVLKHGAIHHLRIEFSGERPSARVLRSLKLETQTEGCVADARTATLYVGEEDRGIWPSTPARMARRKAALPRWSTGGSWSPTSRVWRCFRRGVAAAGWSHRARATMPSRFIACREWSLPDASA